MSPDLLVASGQAALAILVLLLLLSPSTYIHRVISVLTASALGAVSTGLFMLSAPMSGALAAFCAYAWLGIFIFRGSRSGLR